MTFPVGLKQLSHFMKVNKLAGSGFLLHAIFGHPHALDWQRRALAELSQLSQSTPEYWSLFSDILRAQTMLGKSNASVSNRLPMVLPESPEMAYGVTYASVQQSMNSPGGYQAEKGKLVHWCTLVKRDYPKADRADVVELWLQLLKAASQAGDEEVVILVMRQLEQWFRVSTPLKAVEIHAKHTSLLPLASFCVAMHQLGRDEAKAAERSLLREETNLRRLCVQNSKTVSDLFQGHWALIWTMHRLLAAGALTELSSPSIGLLKMINNSRSFFRHETITDEMDKERSQEILGNNIASTALD